MSNTEDYIAAKRRVCDFLESQRLPAGDAIAILLHLAIYGMRSLGMGKSECHSLWQIAINEGFQGSDKEQS